MDDIHKYSGTEGTCILTGNPGCTPDTGRYADFLYYKLEKCQLGRKLLIDGECGDDVGIWSEPMNHDNNFNRCADPRWGGRCGDVELLDVLLNNSNKMNNPGLRLCVAADIIAARAFTDHSSDPSPAEKTQVLTFSKEVGLACYDDEQPDGDSPKECLDYKVQYCCKSKIDIF